jgi:type IX secretion system PorP/SprF family membrane protein
MMKKKSIYFICCLFIIKNAIAQDPHFSQFFMAPQFINPSAVGIGSGSWRAMSNYRQQWGDAGTAFNTKTIAGDISIYKKSPENNHFGIGFTMMTDESMQGAFKSTYASISLAYHLKLSNYHHFGLGLQTLYGNRFIDYSKLNFGEQFTSGGFDITLPTGEIALSNMRPYISMGAGLIYNYNNQNDLNIDFGLAGFNLNKPRQTFMQDQQQYLPSSFITHMNMEYEMNDRLVLAFNGIFKQQAIQNYFALGGSVGREISGGEKTHYIFTGLWFRSGDAIYPYLGMQINNFKIGLSYDVTTSKQIQGPMIPHSFEFSILIKQAARTPGAIPCPGVR